MKKRNLFVGLLTVLMLFSCPSEDDNPSIDPLIGVWKPIKEVETYIDNTINEVDYSECHQKSRYTFNKNGALNIQEFANNEFTGNCNEKTEPVLTSGSWEKDSDGNYRIRTTYTYTANQQSYTDNDIPDVFLFENNNKTLKFGYANDEIIDGKQLKNYYTVFLKVE